MSIERLVRPFQIRDITPPRLVPIPAIDPTAQEQREPAVIKIGENGSLKKLSGSYNEDVTFYMQKVQRETTQNTDNQGTSGSGGGQEIPF